jgi:predicted Zn-dependent protease
MVMIPMEERARIESIELPEAEMYDLHYRVDRALAEHRRADAVATLDAMDRLEAIPHRLALQSRMALARYDGNQPVMLALAEELLKRFPNDANLHLIRLSCLTDFGRRDQRLELLRELCAGEYSHPVFWARLAAELMDDARDHSEAERQLRSALRFGQSNGRALNLYAELLWNRKQRNEALDFYRLAASLSDKDESQARNYFTAVRYMRQTDLVLEWLEDRKQRFGSRSSLPGRTLAWAYEQLEPPQRALDLSWLEAFQLRWLR